ncbi:hypothetical protein KIPB_010796, partial [Kipferlia bialata]|eukprot:g10796.t1
MASSVPEDVQSLADPTSLYIKPVPKNATEDSLMAKCLEIGCTGVDSINLMRRSNRPRGYAFIKFQSVEEARAARPLLEFHLKVKAGAARYSGEYLSYLSRYNEMSDPENTNIYIANLDID